MSKRNNPLFTMTQQLKKSHLDFEVKGIHTKYGEDIHVRLSCDPDNIYPLRYATYDKWEGKVEGEFPEGTSYNYLLIKDGAIIAQSRMFHLDDSNEKIINSWI